MAFQSTTGLGTATQIAVDSKNFSLSLGGVNTHQIVPNVQDVSGAVQTGVALTLSAVASNISAPGTVTPVGSTTGGTLAAATYFYKVTALSSLGETTGSPEASVTT